MGGIVIHKTLYEVLGLRKNASRASIRAAFRKLSMRYHPDRNPGDPTACEMYHAVGEAYAVLSDPEARAHYDKTGEAKRPRDMEFPDIANIIVPIYMQLLRESIRPQPMPTGFGGFVPASRDLRRTDVVAMLVSRIREHRRAVESQANEFRNDHKRYTEMLGRMSVPDGVDNFFESSILLVLGRITPEIKKAEEELVRIDRALEFLGNVRYRRDGDARESLQRMFNARRDAGVPILPTSVITETTS